MFLCLLHMCDDSYLYKWQSCERGLQMSKTKGKTSLFKKVIAGIVLLAAVIIIIVRTSIENVVEKFFQKKQKKLKTDDTK